MHKERLNIIKNESGRYTAYTVNLPVVVEGDTIEECKENAKKLCAICAEEWRKIFAQDDPFETREYDIKDAEKFHKNE